VALASGMQCVRSKRGPVATSPSIGTAEVALKSGWSFMDRQNEGNHGALEAH
jgi:hypothetical protein